MPTSNNGAPINPTIGSTLGTNRDQYSSGARKSADSRKANTNLMIGFAKAMTDEEVNAAAEYFGSMKWTPWIRVVETDTVPRNRIAGGMFVPLPGQETEPIGQRIIEMPANPERTDLRDPRSPFIAYVPVGSLNRGEALVTTGGAGKTIVALMAALVAMENGFQVAFMAPTEILAEQHLATLSRCLSMTKYRVALLSGRVTAADRRTLLPSIERGDVHLVVGTQALVQDQVTFHALSLVIIDEQHRFGVMQRAMLATKGLHPDVLVMTATPIPRTLALTECGDMEVSVIRGLPPGRQPVKTLVKPESRRDEVYDLVREHVES